MGMRRFFYLLCFNAKKCVSVARKTNAGFSVVEGLIALMLLGAAAIGVYSIFGSLDKATLRNRTQLTMMAAESAIVNSLQDSGQMSTIKSAGAAGLALQSGQTVVARNGAATFLDISSGDACPAANYGRAGCLVQIDFQLVQNVANNQWFAGYRISAHDRVQALGVIPPRGATGNAGDPINATLGAADDQTTLPIPIGWTAAANNATCAGGDVDSCCPAGYLIKGYSNGIPQCVRDFYQTGATDANGVPVGTNRCPAGQFALGIQVKTPLGGSINNGSYIDVGELEMNCASPTLVKCPAPGDLDLNGDGTPETTLNNDYYNIESVNPAFLRDASLDDPGSTFQTGTCRVSLPTEVAAISVSVSRSSASDLASSGNLSSQVQLQCPSVDGMSLYVPKSGSPTRCVLHNSIPRTLTLVEGP